MNTKTHRLSCAVAIAAALFLAGCDIEQPKQHTSASGVSKASVQVSTGADGLTTEQRNVRDRLVEDNKPGSIKHLYVISPYSGQVIIYSTVRGKVTSGGKRLTPATVAAGGVGDIGPDWGLPISISGETGQVTTEVLGDDGTYGSSGDYLYWWDVQGRYRQHYLTGGQILHVSSEPLPIKSVIINMESAQSVE